MTRFDIARSVPKAQALAAVPGPDGKRYRELFRHGSLQVEIYRPVGTDPQSPHTRDEAYVSEDFAVWVLFYGPEGGER